jgi:hypothetical protein
VQRWLAVLVAAVLHGIFALAVWQQMRPRVVVGPVQDRPSQLMHIRLIEQSRDATVLAPPPDMPTLPPRPRPPREAPAPGAMTLQLPATPTAPQLYDEHGQPLLPDSPANTSAPDYVQRLPQGDRRIMQHRSPVTYKPTRFEQDWGQGDNSVDDALQKLVDKTTVKKVIRLPGGIRVHCAVSLAMLAGGCGGEPPAAASAKVGDERLSMAPARSLDGHAHAAAPPSETACIEIYRAGKPLPWGCPVDTPNRAVDAELRERAGQAQPSH